MKRTKLFVIVSMIICMLLLVGACFQLNKQEDLAKKEVVVIIDGSASMWATDENGTTRFEKAVQQAKNRIDETFSEDGLVSVILSEGKSQVLYSRVNQEMKREIQTTLNNLLEDPDTGNINCSFGTSDLEGAFALSEQCLVENPLTQIYVYTDTTYEVVPEGVHVVNVGNLDDKSGNAWNAAILNAYTEYEDNYYSFIVDVACYGRDSELEITLIVEEPNFTHPEASSQFTYKRRVMCSGDQTKRVIFLNVDAYQETDNYSDRYAYYLIPDEERVYSYEYVSISLNVTDDALMMDNNYFLYDGYNEDVGGQSVVEKRAFEVGEQILINSSEGNVKVSINNRIIAIFDTFPGSMEVTIPGTYVLTQLLPSGVILIEQIFVKIPAQESNINDVKEKSSEDTEEGIGVPEILNSNKILILESEKGQSVLLEEILETYETSTYEIDVFSIKDAPLNLDELCVYGQIILNNIANKDMPYGFDEVLERYVSECGGGLFTIGGSDTEGNAHAYNRKDMYNTLYQQMLPVQAINYTQPCAVMIILDTSGSMSSLDNSGLTMLDWAKAGAAQCVDMLSDRDYVGLMTLSTDYQIKQELIPCTQKNKLFVALNELDKGYGPTNYAPAIARAGEELTTVDVARRHIIIVSDGQPTDSFETKGDTPGYAEFIDDNYKNHGITLSIIAIGMREGGGRYEELKTATEELGHGNLYMPEIGGEIIELMRKDLHMPAIDESTEIEYMPVLSSLTSPIANGVEYVNYGTDDVVPVVLNGFYGVKAKKSADVYLESMYGVPLYAQWKYGKGMVGSFMCDLNGRWSSEFLNDENGKKLLFNMITGLMPESTHSEDMDFLGE